MPRGSLTKKKAGPSEGTGLRGGAEPSAAARDARGPPLRYADDGEERAGVAPPAVEAERVEAQEGAGLGPGDRLLELLDRRDRLAVDLGDDVARPDELLVERAVGLDLVDPDALDVARDAVAFAQARREVLVFQAEPADAAPAIGLIDRRFLVAARTLAELDHLLELLAVAQDVEGDLGVRPLARDVVDQVARGVDRAAVDSGQDVAVHDPGVRRRRVVLDLADQSAVGPLEAERLRGLEVQVLDLDAQIAAADLPLVAQLRQDLLERRDRHGEADVLGAVVDRCRDPDHPAVHVDERAARVAEVDRGVGLDEVLERGVADADRSPLGADHAGGDRLVEVERIADDHHPVADARPVAVAELEEAQAVAGVDLEQSDVGRRVDALDLRRVVALAQVDADARRAVDHVVVGDHQAVGRDDEAAAARLLPAIAAAVVVLAAGASRSATVARAEEEFERIHAARAAPAAARS